MGCGGSVRPREPLVIKEEKKFELLSFPYAEELENLKIDL